MNPIWLYRNVIESWRNKASSMDALKRLLWIYTNKVPRSLIDKEFEIGFSFPAPVCSVRFVVRSNNGSDAFIFGEVFNHLYYQLGLSRQPKTILDLGANAGFVSVYFARAYPDAQIACVEPMPDNARVLRRNLELNSVPARVFPAAAAVEDGQVVMEVFHRDYGHRIIDGSSPEGAQTLEVPALSIPTIQRELGWDRIGLLKVDIEGYEKELLNKHCQWLRTVDAMCVECHNGFGLADLQRIATEFGFQEPVALPGIWLLHRE